MCYATRINKTKVASRNLFTEYSNVDVQTKVKIHHNGLFFKFSSDIIELLFWLEKAMMCGLVW